MIFGMFSKLNGSLNEHGNRENCVFNFCVHCLELTVRVLQLNAKR